MVSTRLMSIVNDNLADGCAQGISSSSNVVTRVTRNSCSHAVASTSAADGVGRSSVSVINVLEMPPEILEKIMSNLSFKNICQLRLVWNLFFLYRYGVTESNGLK